MKRKRDLILVLFIISASLIAMLCIQLFSKKGNVAYVYIDNRLVDTISLNSACEKEYTTDDGSNRVTVKDNSIRIEAADCPDQVCVNMGFKDRDGETITCLPHKLIIEVKSYKERDVDIQ